MAVINETYKSLLFIETIKKSDTSAFSKKRKESSGVAGGATGGRSPLSR
jgi:hypothetical protein